MKRLFVDMDGCVARFYDEQNYLEAMYEEGFFEGLGVYNRMVSGLNRFMKKHPEVPVCIISAFPQESPFAKGEKNEWLDDFFPIKDRIFMFAGEDKSKYVPDISCDDYLLDDHTPNLLKWETAGGAGIKVKNGINCRTKKWTGSLMDVDDSPDEIASQLEELLGLN